MFFLISKYVFMYFHKETMDYTVQLKLLIAKQFFKKV